MSTNGAINAYVAGILTLDEARAVVGPGLGIALDVEEKDVKSTSSDTVGNTPIVAYEAFAEKTRPVCLYAGDGGKNVTVYWGDEGIRGVVLYGDDDEIIGTLGEVPSA